MSDDDQKWCDVNKDLSTMRKGSISMEDPHSEVVPREFLCCPLCREEYQDPKYLPCLHSFCKACIDEHIHATSDQGCFACPVCATETVVPEGEDQTESPALPDNVFARRLSCPTIIQGKRDKFCGQCETAGSSVDATTHCINCDEFLCGQCSLNHLDQEETASHKTQKIENYEEGDTNLMPTSVSPTLQRCCQYYDALDIGSMYCVDCEMSLCAECHGLSHTDHRCAELSAISQNFENKIKDPLKELKKDKHTLQKSLAALDNVKKYTAKKQAEIQQSVKKRTNFLCALIQDYENVLTLEIEKRHARNKQAIQEREDAIQRHIASIKAVTDLTEKLLTFGSEEEKVSMRRKIGRRVRELCEEDLPPKHVELTKYVLSEPIVTVETICELFGELKQDVTKAVSKKKVLTTSHSLDLGVMSRRGLPRTSISSTEEIPTELTDLEEHEEGEDMDMLSASNTSDVLRPASSLLSGSGNSNEELKLGGLSGLSPRHLEVPDASHTDSSFQSSVGQEDVPCHNLEETKRELLFPDVVVKDCIKGVGVNQQGDIIVGTVSPGGNSKVFLLEKHGFVRGQIPVDKNWGLHSIAADGKVSLVVPRSENRYKVKVMSGENNIEVLADAYIENFGLNYVTATKEGNLLVAANRYATTNTVLGRSAKSGGNITMYDKEGSITKVITNEHFADQNLYLFDRPHCIAVDQNGFFFVADPGRHSVLGFKADGDFLFEYGNTDVEEELYQGPDAICIDRHGNVIVFDKKDGRIDILDYSGHLLRCYFPSEHIRFVCVTPDKMLLLVNSEGEMKFYNYT